MGFGHMCKKTKNCLLGELRVGGCRIGMTQAIGSGLILAVKVGKYTDEFIQELVVNKEGKTDCQQWCTDGWESYQRVLGNEVSHIIGKEQTQHLERTNGIVRQQTGRWASSSELNVKVWRQTEATARLIVKAILTGFVFIAERKILLL